MGIEVGKMGRAVGSIPLYCNICRQPLRPSVGISVLQIHSDKPWTPPSITVCGDCESKHFSPLPEA